MSLTTKVLLNKVRQKEDGTYPLVVRLTYNRKVIYIPLGYALPEKDFDASNQRIKNSSKISDNITRLNNIIQSKVRNIYDVITKLEDTGLAKSLTVKEIKQHIAGKRETETVVEFIDRIIQELSTAKKFGNAAVYKTLRNKLLSFAKPSLTFQQITYQFLKEFETSHYESGNDAGGLSVYMRTLKATYNRAIKSGHISSENHPFNDYKIKNGKPVRKALSEDDFKALVNYQFESGSPLDRAKKLFVASFYLRGMNWMDMAYLDQSNIDGDFERVTYVRRKTNEPFNIKINTYLKEIILEFAETEPSIEDDYIFPILKQTKGSSNTALTIRNKRKRLNKRLKEIAQILEIKNFTFYAARHTYATMAKRKGVPTAIIQEGLGHSTENMTQTYLDSFENSVIDDYDQIIMGN